MLDNVLKVEISANVVAWYGAIVATASMCVAFLNYLRDTAKIKIRLSQGFLVQGSHLGEATQIFIEAINVGRRSVTLNGAGLSLSNRKTVALIRPEMISFPFELQEGKAIQVWVDKNQIFQDAARERARITHAWYRDATGKVHRTRFNIRKN